MNILVLCLSPGRGGLELYANREENMLAEMGHNIYSVSSGKGVRASAERRSFFERCTLNSFSHIFPLLSSIKLAMILMNYNISIMHIHWSKDLNLAVFAKIFAGIFNHNISLVYSRHMGITRRKHDVYHRFLYRHVNKILVITNQVLQQAQQFLPVNSSDIELLYHGVPNGNPKDADSCESFLKDKALQNRRFKIALFGRIEHGKGQHVLIDAMNILTKGGADIGVLIIGHVMDQKYFDKLMQFVKEHGLEGRISFLDYIDEPQGVMPCFDAVVLTTYCETFGLVLVEAMRAGVVVIGTNAGGVLEIIEHEKSGLMFAPGDEKELADCILRLSQDDPFREELAKAGKERADEMFAEDIHFSKLEKILSAVCY